MGKQKAQLYLSGRSHTRAAKPESLPLSARLLLRVAEEGPKCSCGGPGGRCRKRVRVVLRLVRALVSFFELALSVSLSLSLFPVCVGVKLQKPL